jgi:hypothetical protein
MPAKTSLPVAAVAGSHQEARDLIKLSFLLGNFAAVDSL